MTTLTTNILKLIFLFEIIPACSASVPKLLIVSLDGFRYDYLTMYEAPILTKFAKEGVYAPEGMIPSFPTVTFPNHYTLVTGLYPESHGVVYNTMYDPNYNESFSYRNNNTDSKWWNATRPIWITDKKSSIKTGASFWPGNTVDFDGSKADFVDPYVHKTPFGTRIDKMVEWLSKSDSTFGAIYFEQPDSEGHKYGPISQNVSNMVTVMDNWMEYLFKKLEEKKILDEMNIIIVSDHGMSNVTRDDKHALVLNDYLQASDYITISQIGSVGAIMPAEGKTQEVYDKLKNVNKNIKIYLKKDIPERFNYRNNDRIMPIVAISDEHYIVVKNQSDLDGKLAGIHGYDNQLKVMRPIFMAKGPAFKEKIELPPFENVNVYPLMCHLLNIQPHSCNGSVDVFKSALRGTGATNLAQSNVLIICTMVLLLTKYFCF